MRIVAGLLFLGAMLSVASFSAAQPPDGGKGKGGPGGPGGKDGFGPPRPGQIMPAFLQDALKLTDAQKKDLEALQKDVDAKLAKILTEDQQKQLKEMRGRGPGGDKGFPGGKGGEKGPPGKGGEKGPPPKGDKGKGEPQE